MKMCRVCMFVVLALVLAGGCSDDETVGTLPPTASDLVVLAWNDLGMHCLNPTYDQAVILPPYNTVWVQVVERGDPPRIVTGGVTVEYRLLNNTSSSGKTDQYGGDFAQFWQHDQELFGVDLAVDTGLNLVDPERHNGLAGTMVPRGDHFEVDGVPVVPVSDDGTWNPYQVMEITVKDADGAVVATTRATVPTSDEIDCARCHAAGGSATGRIGGGTDDPFANILAVHDAMHGTALVAATPVLCASCHASPALGGTAADPADYLSARIHGSHADRGATCLDCHPGTVTQCNRSLAHTAADGNCTTCHGTMAQVASSIVSEGRVPWVNEPKCATCHGDVSGVDTGTILYRDATGHGGLYCAACHGSPHAMVPSREASDNYQVEQYQGAVKTLGSCGACHGSSRGEGSSEFAEKHGGSNPERLSACNVCHTATPTTTAGWPHAYTWHDHGGVGGGGDDD